MGTNHAVGLAFIPFLVLLAAGCGGDSSSGGGGCQNLAGTYHSTTSTCNSGGDNVITQSGCSVTIASGGQSFTGTVSGNKFSSTPVTCTVTINGSSYSADCTQSDGMGHYTPCQESGTVTDRPVIAMGAGGGVGFGAGGSGFGAGGNGFGSGGAGFAGSGFGAGGAVVGNNCGPVWSNTDANCNACMNSMCCSQLGGCKAGTACDAFLTCAATNCSSGDAACLQNVCGTQLQAAAPAVTALSDCNTQNCQSCQ